MLEMHCQCCLYKDLYSKVLSWVFSTPL
uniref:Uncharacterized protein n=1 Tax=Rhizophora mucronata TaxID=61149 RepID=A0A2P2QKT6_RHIMU